MRSFPETGSSRPLDATARAQPARRSRRAWPPNDLWCADFKGEFKLGDGRYCCSLTVPNHGSRYLLLCEALESTREYLGHRFWQATTSACV
jgi:transposase InsO family protein